MTTPFLALALFLPLFAHAGGADCRQVPKAVEEISATDKDPELRSRVGTCLIRNHLDQAEVSRAALRILRDPAEDLLLKEDLIDAFADAPLRKKVKVESHLAPKLGQMDKVAVERALSGAGSLLAAAQAVESMDDIEATCRYEADFVRTISDLALDSTSHVLLRASGVRALEKISAKTYQSGVFDEKLVRLMRDTLRTVSARDDLASESLNAGVAYNHLAVAGLPGYAAPASSGRMLSSVKNEK